ncbi:Crp/Fnr family transcriptional regulator [Bradyrhizobium sp. NAS96.2]|uniref:Crp/Fnr family transcriptional regulator n=1 Tax=Bradyrhizobium sp. NAS96.2 TaxID=1680160 RepID=UPI00093CCBA0|nr:Crp/Fnr family transcriptional regulator [Bradyrhizobium sp. NAS96.2]OKO78117.1 cyclic nucleotide-binding protein [Bradyrhizobium sp. NAS96.2]
MRFSGGTGNRLLATLPAADIDLLGPDLETVALDQDAVLTRAGDEIDYVFFPHSGAILLMIDMADGHTVATGVVGREGVVGSLSVLGSSPSGITAVVGAAGTASRLPAARFHAAFGRSAAIRQAMQKHIRSMLIQFQRGSACNALHPVEARMARWLLQLRDRIDSDVLPLTQHALSQILGVRRTTVTLLMRNLRTRGAIRSEQRGRIEIDRSRLSALACECHRVMRVEAEEIFSGHQSRAAARTDDPRISEAETDDAM